MTFCFKCPTCGRVYEKRDRGFVGSCENTHRMGDDTLLRRDYLSEGLATRILPTRFVDTR